MEKNIPLGKFCKPEDIAEAVLFLASDRARMITGQSLTMDGGWMLGLASDYSKDMERRKEASKAAVLKYKPENR